MALSTPNDRFDTVNNGRSAANLYADFLAAFSNSRALYDVILCAVVRRAIERRVNVIRLAKQAGLPRSTVDNLIALHSVKRITGTVAILAQLAAWAELEITIDGTSVSL